MSNRTVYYWEVYCETTLSYQYVWADEEPTTCPENDTHTISTNPGPRTIDKIQESEVRIKEELDGVTQGVYKFKGYKQIVPAGPTGNVTTFAHTWNYPITVMNGWLNNTPEMVGDCINASVADNTTIGAIGAPVYSGNTEITVTSTVLDNLLKGYYVNITDGVNNDNLGQCIAIDSGNSRITVAESAVNNFSPLSPTYVQMTVKMIEDFHVIVPNTQFTFAGKKVGGRFLPAGIPLNIHYQNDEGNSKPFVYYLEYLH